MDTWWRLRSLCADNTRFKPDWWILDGRRRTLENYRAAGICASCPVMDECWLDCVKNPKLAEGQVRAGEFIDSHAAKMKKLSKEREKERNRQRRAARQDVNQDPI